MILQRLVEYYDRIATDPQSASQLPKTGYSLQKITFCVVLTSAGRLQQFQSLLDSGKKKPLPRQLLVPGQSKPSGSGFNPCFLWDNAAYMLGFKPEDTKPERTQQSFEAFREKHVSVEQEVNSAAFTAVCVFLRDWSPRLNGDQYANDLKDIVGGFGVFRIAGQQGFVHDDPAVVSWWLSHHAQAGEDASQGFCLVSGQQEPIARLHEPKIKGVRNAKTSGALLVSFNDDAYESFGKTQSYNAPVSVSAAFKYANALNYLLRRDDRRISLGDATVVFWAERPTPLEDFISDLFSASPLPGPDAPVEDKRRADQLRLFLSQLREGYALNELDTPGTRFFILGLSPNAARISVRFWADTTVAEMEDRLRQHLQDIDLVGSREGDSLLKIKGIVQATGRAESDAKGQFRGYDGDSVAPLLAGAIARAVLTGGPYPQSLLSSMVRRIRSDNAIRHPRVAAIKACLVRNSRLNGNPKEVPVALDINRSEPAYVTGRLFALLEKIQEDSSEGNLNATIKDRYFSSASATPGVVFPRLIRLSQHHLAKIEGGLKVYREKQLGEVMGKVERFPSHFNLEDQGLFSVGYFHQRQDLFTRKDNKTKEGESE
jgi:CRISPR-associated protein Csd1